MTTYAKVSLSVRSLSREYLEGLFQLTLDLLVKESIALDFDDRLQTGIKDFNLLFEAFKNKANKSGDKEPTLVELDRQRDMDLTDFLFYIRSQLRHRQDKRRQAAQDLYEEMKQFDEARSTSQVKQTRGVRDLLSRLEDKEVRAKVHAINANDYVVNIKESQAAFEAAYLKKTQERQASKTQQLETARLALVKHYRELYGYLLAMEYFDKDGPHRPVLAAFNAARLTYQDKLKRQAKKKSKDSQAVSETMSVDD